MRLQTAEAAAALFGLGEGELWSAAHSPPSPPTKSHVRWFPFSLLNLKCFLKGHLFRCRHFKFVFLNSSAGTKHFVNFRGKNRYGEINFKKEKNFKRSSDLTKNLGC